MKSSSRSGMRRSARVLAGGLVMLGLGAPALAQPPAPAVSPYAVQPPKPPAALRVDQPPVPAVDLKKDEPAKPNVTIGPADSTPAAPTPVTAEPVLYVPPLAHVPPVTPMPRTGGFLLPPDEPGYYSLLDFLKRQPRLLSPDVPYPYHFLTSGLPFDADFRYLDDPTYTDRDWLDSFKRIHFQVRDDWLVSFGGEYRYRYMNETDSRLTSVNNNYSLFRPRVHMDAWKGEDFRVFIEFLGAYQMNNSLPPLPTDRNPAEIQNLFIDYRLLDAGGAPVFIRGGRQEMLYGSQRLISPNDWANSPQRFDGVKMFWHGCDWDVDAFWTKPVIYDPTYLDPWDLNQNFSGAWVTWKPKKGSAVDFYVLNWNQSTPVATGRNGVRGGFDITTFGIRAAGDLNGQFLYDHEAMLQTGIRARQEVEAGAFTFGFGYRAKNLPWNPTIWVYDDWASGTGTLGGPGKNTTFSQMFPFSHAYLGYMDFVGRQNINDFNLQFSVNPANWVLFLVQYHNFMLESSRDALYNAAGEPVRIDPTGNSGRAVGSEVDYLVHVRLTPRQELLFGYSRFYAGNYLRLTGTAGPADLFYGQYTLRW